MCTWKRDRIAIRPSSREELKNNGRGWQKTTNKKKYGDTKETQSDKTTTEQSEVKRGALALIVE